MRFRKALPALALVALLSGTTSVALADRPSRDGGSTSSSSQQQNQSQEQRQSIFPGAIDEIPGLSQSDGTSSSSSSGTGTDNQSQQQSQDQSQCLICLP